MNFRAITRMPTFVVATTYSHQNPSCSEEIWKEKKKWNGENRLFWGYKHSEKISRSIRSQAIIYQGLVVSHLQSGDFSRAEKKFSQLIESDRGVNTWKTWISSRSSSTQKSFSSTFGRNKALRRFRWSTIVANKIRWPFVECIGGVKDKINSLWWQRSSLSMVQLWIW